MNKTTWMPVAAAIVMSAGLIAISGKSVTAAQDSVQEIEISAKKFDFTPSEIHVKKGAHVRLKVTATDRDHGLEVDPRSEGSDKKSEPGLKFPVDKPTFKLPKNEVQAVEFTADQPGTYDFKCSDYCGSGHKGMKGRIIVDP
ncbi:MAG TPA: cupredoxin domain-containing protein [Candidatus Acidoferrum sp.]|nr:cupredoxin domain-containing protein [Candidatus Acidoferrum sp.]